MQATIAKTLSHLHFLAQYEFFLKASELERIDRTYANTQDTLEDLKQSHSKVIESIRPAEERLERLKKKWKEHQELEKLEYKSQELKVKYAWALHREAEEEHAEKANTVASVEEKLEDKEKQLREEEAAHSGQGDQTQQKDQLVKDLSSKVATQTELQKKLLEDLKDLAIPQKKRRRELDSLKQQKAQAHREMVAAQKKLDDRLAEIAHKTGSADSENARRREELKVAEEKLERANARVDELTQTLANQQRDHETAETNAQNCRQAVKNASSQFNQAKRILAGLESGGNNSMSIFGRNVDKVHGMVERARSEGRFRGPVVGPIGAYLKLNPGKEKYRDVVEVALGQGVFDGWIVTTQDDLGMLQTIRRKAGCVQDCGVYRVSVTPRHRVPGPPVDGVETGATILKIEDDLVFNCLVDQKQIEKMGFGESKQSSQDKLLVKDASGRSATRGRIKQVYFLPKGDMWSVRAGQISLISTTRKARGYLSADKTEAISAARRELDSCEEELRRAEEENHRMDGEHTQSQRAWNEARKAKQANDRKIDELSETIHNMRIEIENQASDAVDDTSGEQEAVDDAKDREAAVLQRIQQTTKTMDENEPAISELKEKADEAGVEAKKLEEELHVAEDDLLRYTQTQSQQVNVIQKKKDKIEKLREKLDELHEAAGKAEADEEEALRKARVIQYMFTLYKERREADDGGADQSDVVTPTEEELESIFPSRVEKESGHYESRIARTMEKLEQERERNQLLDQTKEEALEAYQTAKEELHAQLQNVNQLKEKIKDLKSDLSERKKRWVQFREVIQNMTSVKFAEMLEMNRFEGDLEFDNESQTLDLCVSKRGSDKSQTKDMKALR